MITRLLVGLNGTSYTPAVISQAMELVEQHGCDITATAFLGKEEAIDSVFGSTGSLSVLLGTLADRADDLMALIELQANELQRLCEHKGRRFDIGRFQGDQLRAVQRQSRFCDLTVFGPGGWSELEAVRDPLEHLRELTLAGVHPVLCTTEEHQPVKRVLFCLRPSPTSCASWRHFLQLKPWPKAGVVLLAIGEREEIARGFLDDAAALGRSHGMTVDTVTVAEGEVPEMIMDQAGEFGCQAVVIGPSGRSGLIKRFLGDVATELVDRSELPVLIVD